MPRRTQAQIILEEAQNFLSASRSTEHGTIDQQQRELHAENVDKRKDLLIMVRIDQESVGTTRPVKTTGICNGTFEAKQGKQI